MDAIDKIFSGSAVFRVTILGLAGGNAVSCGSHDFGTQRLLPTIATNYCSQPRYLKTALTYDFAQQQRYDRQVALWLLLCAAVIFGMIMLGGMTRLTGSGLSMVEWKPLMGVVPPLSEAQWQETFEKYQQYPEYQEVNRGMDVHGFKYIFMYEYLHRVLGRIIGILFFFPMVYFAMKGRGAARLYAQACPVVFYGRFPGLTGLVHGEEWPG